MLSHGHTQHTEPQHNLYNVEYYRSDKIYGYINCKNEFVCVDLSNIEFRLNHSDWQMHIKYPSLMVNSFSSKKFYLDYDNYTTFIEFLLEYDLLFGKKRSQIKLECLEYKENETINTFFYGCSLKPIMRRILQMDDNAFIFDDLCTINEMVGVFYHLYSKTEIDENDNLVKANLPLLFEALHSEIDFLEIICARKIKIFNFKHIFDKEMTMNFERFFEFYTLDRPSSQFVHFNSVANNFIAQNTINMSTKSKLAKLSFSKIYHIYCGPSS